MGKLDFVRNGTDVEWPSNASKRTEPTVIAIKSKSIKWYSSYFQKIFLTNGGKCLGSLKIDIA